MVRASAKDLVEVIFDLLKSLHQQGIEAARWSLDNHLDRRIVRQRAAAVRAGGAQSVVNVYQGDHAGGKRDIRAGDSIGIAATIEVFMVMAGNIDGHWPKG